MASPKRQRRIFHSENKEIKERFLDYIKERFGIEHKKLIEQHIYLTTNNRILLGPKLHFEPLSAGITAGRLSKSGNIKPTTTFIQLFGNLATKNVVELTKEEAVKYLEGLDIRKNAEVEEGYVIVKYIYPLGCGLYRKGIIENVLPKAKRQKIKYI